MKKLSTAGCLVLLLAAAVGAQEDKQKSTTANVAGAWALQVETGAGSGSPSATFKQDGEKLSGKYVGTFGEAELTGTIKGRDITWSVDANFEGNSFKIVYVGTVDGDSMKGSVTLGDLAEGTFTGKRK
jgi:hypothetical protein